MSDVIGGTENSRPKKKSMASTIIRHNTEIKSYCFHMGHVMGRKYCAEIGMLHINERVLYTVHGTNIRKHLQLAVVKSSIWKHSQTAAHLSASWHCHLTQISFHTHYLECHGLKLLSCKCVCSCMFWGETTDFDEMLWYDIVCIPVFLFFFPLLHSP